MKAVIQDQYGGPEVLKTQEIDIPTPKDNEVLIKVRAASVTTADSMMMTGKPYIGRLFLGLTKPKYQVPGTGFAGIVEARGSEVTKYEVGDEVFGESLDTFGGQAEYISLPEDGLFLKKPENISFEAAASVCDGVVTSINLLKNVAEIKSGQTVLINGASGSLGSAAVQLAVAYGAKVTGVCSARNVAFVKSLGAHHVIDYRTEDFTKSADTYDIVYDTVGKSSFKKAANCLKEGGIYASPVLEGRLLWDVIRTAMFGKKKARFSATGALPKAELERLISEATELIKTGDVQPHIERTYDLDEVHQAHHYIASGHKKGNVVFAIG